MVADTYTIEALIGRGGMGAVFLASHNRLPGKQVAIKVLHTDAGDADILARFRREAEIASRLGHPNIVGVSDFNVTADGMPYLVLEYLVGESLAQRLQRGPLAVAHALSIARQVGSALAAAHREGIVHRDLKPQNIFLVSSEHDGRSIEIAKVLDFGISKIRGSQTVKTQESALLGTPQYMAPEQATGQQDKIDERTDLFAFGGIVYEMLAGIPAFSGASIPEVVFKVVYEKPRPLAELVPGAPPHVVAAVERAMEKSSVERYATVGEFIEALTGEPFSPRSFSSIAAPDVGFATGTKASRPGRTAVSSEDALAATMGSGDHGASPLPPADGATADSRVDRAIVEKSGKTRGTEATVASLGPSVGLDATMPPTESKRSEPIPPAAIDSTVPDVARPPRRPTALIAALAVVAIVAIVVATRGTKKRKRAAPDAATIALVAPVAADATPLDAEVAALAPSDAAIDAPAAAIDAGRPAVRDARAPVATPKLPEDPPTADLLREAETQVAAKDYNGALDTAQRALVTEHGTDDQKAHALALKGVAQCGRGEEDFARASLRKAGAWRQRALRLCHAMKMLANDN